MKHSITVSIFLLLAGSMASAQQRFVFRAGMKVTTTVYQPIDIVFDAGKLPPGNLFDVMFGAIVADNTSQSDTIYGFYNGDKEFVLRFSPGKQGDYTFQTFSSFKKLSALKGSIKAGANANPDIHGIVKVSERAPQKFEYQDGTPYFALPFELDWLFALDIENKTALPKTTEIVQAVKENGFNQIVMNVYAYETS